MADRIKERRAAVVRIVACDVSDHYSILAIDFTAEQPAIIKSYQRLSLLVHPDKCPDPRAKDAMQRLNNSKECLTDPELKEKWEYERANGNKPHNERRHQHRPFWSQPPKPRGPEKNFGKYDTAWRQWEYEYQKRQRKRPSKRGPRMPPSNFVTNIDGQPLIEFGVISVGKVSNTFWRAFALSYHFNVDRWAEVKVQVGDYFFKVLSDKNHPRWGLYQALNQEAKKKHQKSLRVQLTQANEKTTPELYQIVADLFSVELMVVHSQGHAKEEDLPHHTMIPRGQNGDRQIFLQLAVSNRYHVLRIKEGMIYPKWYAQMRPHTPNSDEQRCPLPGWKPNGKKFCVPERLEPRPKREKVDQRKVRQWANDAAAQK